MKQISLLFLTIFLLGCNSKQSSSTVLSLDEGTPVTAQEYDHELIIKNPLDLTEVDGKLLLFMHSGESPILVLNPGNGMVVGHWSKFGNGPDEFTAPIYWGHNSSKQELYLYDMNYRNLRTYHYQAEEDSLAFTSVKEVVMKDNAIVQHGTVLDNHNIATSVIYYQDAPILLLDEELTPLSAFGGLDGQEMSPEQMRTYTGRLSSYENEFIVGMNNFGYLAYYEQTDTTTSKKWEVYLEKPVYKGKNLDVKNLKRGFVDVELTKNYVICSYCGKARTRGDGGLFGYNILVFDHKGKLLHNLKLDKAIGHIAVSEDEKTIYAVAYEPDVCIVRYSLDNL